MEEATGLPIQAVQGLYLWCRFPFSVVINAERFFI